MKLVSLRAPWGLRETMADYSGQINAINKSQAVIEFDLKGNVVTANENFWVRWATGWRKSKENITACL